MNSQSLIVHNGVTHQKSSPAAKPETDSQIVAPPSNNSSDKPTTDTLDKVNLENTTKVLTTETPTAPDSANITLFTGFGESVFALLIASPFLLTGLKKWLHR